MNKSRIALALLALLMLGCTENPKRIHEKLETMIQSDLTFMVAETEKASGKKYLLEKPYFVIDTLQFFQGDTARIYGGYAVVNFYYYKDIAIFQKRKYRYDARYYFWDRYFKQLQFSAKPAGEPDTSVVDPFYAAKVSKTAKFPK